jgi:signal transduction histidine kinase
MEGDSIEILRLPPRSMSDRGASEVTAMSAPESVGYLSFRRTFTLLILLVVVPSAGLSGFGVLAIINERAAVEKRLEAVWGGRLTAIQEELLGEAGALDAANDPRLMEALLIRVGSRLEPADGAQFVLVPVENDGAGSVVARLVAGVAAQDSTLFRGSELASRALPPPLQKYRLVAISEEADPVAQASWRNRVVYGVLLVVFYATLVFGVVYTARALYREAKLSRLKTDFVSLVSHELRTPLTSIRLFIETLALGRVKDPNEMQTVLDLLAKETARLSAMIESVLDWGRIESGRKQYLRTEVQVTNVITAAVDAFRTHHRDDEMQFDVELSQPLGLVTIDADAIAGALLNLLHNAFKYSGPNRRLTLRSRRRDGEVVLEVEDNGIGVPRGEQKRIFERFYRVDSVLSRATEGSGLGLSIAHRIVQAHGGRITLDSTVGKGSIFRIHLPVTE